MEEDSDHETSQILVDTSLNTVYENRLRVRGREGGDYCCNVTGRNNITSDPFPVHGRWWHVVVHTYTMLYISVEQLGLFTAHGELYCSLCIAEYVFQ